MTEPLVSVVTPFYNTQAYLGECIESVLRQTYRNWEYILIDNWSTDGSSEIARTWAARYPDKIRIVRPESFLSQVRNYNFALSCISPGSKYCKMVQADDWMFPQCLESMVELAEKHPRVGIVSSYELEGNRVSLDGLSYLTRELSGREVCRIWFTKGEYFFGSPTSLLMRSELVRSRSPFYDEARTPFEDTHACFDLLRDWDFGFVHQVLTFSRRDNESILQDTRTFGMLYSLHLSTLVIHGRDYLTQDEYNRYLNIAEREYFRYLGKCRFRGKGEKFWEFHRSQMASIDYSLDWRLWIRWIPLAMLEYIGNPKHTLDALWDRRAKLREAVSRRLR